MKKRFDSILDTVGNTPIVRINRLAPEGVNLYVKIEAFNPLGSVKDRLALGIIEGPWLLNVGVVALAVLAIASVIAGLNALIGPAGIALGALLIVFVGNPWSGIASAPELLPKAAGLIGQLLPPGAGGNLLRNTAFFDGAGGGGQLAVLLVWTALGLGAIMAGAVMQRRRTAVTS